ncbi:hypothetical protein KM043_007460 [Ampulex compressa]|nr:hypothetical protein KM043_007460 [Ampulex compressa]
MPKCWGVDYRKIPVHVALNLAAKALTSVLYAYVTEEELRRPRLSREHPGMRDTPEDVLDSAAAASSLIKDLLYFLEKLPSNLASEKLGFLSFLFQDMARNFACRCERLRAESLRDEQTKVVLNLVNNIIWEWIEESSQIKPGFTICKFCNNVKNEVARKWRGRSRSGIGVDVRCRRIYPEGGTPEELDVPGDSARRSKVQHPAWAAGVRPMDRRFDCSSYTDEDKRNAGDFREKKIEGKRRHKLESYNSVAEDERGIRETSGLERTRARVEDDESRFREQPEMSSRRRADDSYGREAGKIVRKARRELEPGEESRVARAAAKKEGGAAQRTKRNRSPGQDSRGRNFDKARGATSADNEAAANQRGKKEKKRRMRKESVGEEEDLAKGTKRTRGEENIAKRIVERPEKMAGRDDEEKLGGGRRKIRGDALEEREMATVSKSKEAGESGRKKPDALDSERRGVSYKVDEEGKLLKSDGRGKGRSRKGRLETDDSDLTKGRASGESSTLDSDGPKRREDRGKRRAKLPDSGRTVDDDYGKINGSRYRGRKAGISKVCDLEPGPSSAIEYQLSEGHFASLGWTVLPVTRATRKIVRYQSRPAKPRFDCPGRKDLSGSGAQSRIVAIFDTIGNGAVFDEGAGTRLSYNQIGGICTDNPNGLPFAWTWRSDAKESIPEIVRVEKSVTRLERLLQSSVNQTIESSGSVRAPVSPTSPWNKEKKVEERKPVVGEDQEEVESGSNFEGYPEKGIAHFKTICMRINEYLALRILDRQNINLRFFANGSSIRIELGTTLNFKRETGSYFVDSSDWKNMLRCRFQEEFSGKLDSDDELRELAEELRKIRKLSERRKTTVSKYKPRALQVEGSRQTRLSR